MFFDCLESDIGKIHLLADDAGLRQLTLSIHHPFEPSLSWIHSPSKLAGYKRQLSEYLQGKRKVFDLPLAPDGTEFQHRVWQQLRKIPYGETRSYSALASEIGNPLACRAVGMASNVNPIPIIIPCHRVIAADGKLSGYRYGVEIKQKLLALEQGQPL